MQSCLRCPSRAVCGRYGCRLFNSDARRKIEQEENQLDRMVEEVCDQIADVFNK